MQGGVPELLTFSHSFRLEPAGTGTRVIQREQFRGVGVFFGDLDWVEPGYQEVNVALKRRAEEIEQRDRKNWPFLPAPPNRLEAQLIPDL